MRYSTIFWRIFLVLIYPALLSTLFLYFYPAFWSCDFSAPTKDDAASSVGRDPMRNVAPTIIVPFRLLVLADPQLEGDSSLPDPDLLRFPSWQKLRSGDYSDGGFSAIAVAKAAKAFLVDDVPLLFASYRKRLDLLGNDFYLAHIYRTLHWWTLPSHVVVLGDLIGSQWVSDGEFDWRGWRYWNRVFKGAQKVDEDIMKERGRVEVLRKDGEWTDRVINIAGNHDIGYAGDIDNDRIERFRKVFGQENWDIKFHLNQTIPSPTTSDEPPTAEQSPPELHLVILNSMNLDGPVLSSTLQSSTYDFVNNDIISNSRPVGDSTSFTIVLTHIPLHKPAGMCVDGPCIDYGQHGVKEQNHLSPGASRNILEGIFGMSGHPHAPGRGMGRNGVILNGHDHAGCDVYHYVDANGTEDPGDVWKAVHWSSAETVAQSKEIPGIREITVRSMMGELGGNAGLFSAWFDDEVGEWRFEYSTCSLGVQHLWWGIHILDIVALLSFVAAVVSIVCEDVAARIRVVTRPKVPEMKKRQ